MSQPARPYREAARYYRARPPYSAALRDTLSALLGWNGQGRLLDVGCGPGVVALDLAPSFAEVVGVDPEETMLEEARSRAGDQRNVRWVRGRAEDLADLDLGLFDAVTFAQSFHWTDRESVAEIVYRLLVPGGAMLVINPDAGLGLDGDTPPPQGVQTAHPPVPHTLIREVIATYLPPAPGAKTWKAVPGAKTQIVEPHEAVLARSRFGAPQEAVLPGRTNLIRTPDDIIDSYLGTSFAAPERFGERLETFRAELKQLLLRNTPTGLFWLWPGDTHVLVARKAA